MSDQTLYIDVFTSAGVKLGSGPVTGASDWTYTGRMSRAGDFSFTVPATDSQATLIQKTRIVRAYALFGTTWTPVGAGIIDHIERQPQANGQVFLRVSGSDLIRELTFRSVKDLKLYSGGNPVTHSASVTAVAAYAPAGWTFTADTAPPNNSIYGRYNNETVLTALIKIAEKSEDHFFGGVDRTLTFASSFTPSGIRAIQAGAGDLVAETCAIVGLRETIDSFDLITRVYPHGSGNGDVQLTLKATTQSAPAGFTLSTANNYLENDAATATYGLREQSLEYREIGPIANTDADVQAAADMLFLAALEELTRRSTEAESAYYDLTLAGCSALLRPLQTLRVVYRDDDAGINLDTALNILEATWRVDATGVQTTALKVTSVDRWPQSDTKAIVDSMAQGQVYQAHPQLNANSYVTAYRGNLDLAKTTTFRFRFGAEVVQLQQVLFEFQVLPLEATVRAVGGASSGSGSLRTAVPSVNTSSTPSNNTSGAPSNNTSGAASGDTGAAAGNTAAVVGNTGAASGDTGNAAGDTGNAAGDTGIASGDTGIASGDTGGSGTLTSDGPDGGEIDGAGHHHHDHTIVDDATGTALKIMSIGGGQYILQAALGTGNGFLRAIARGDHDHDITTHVHTLNSHVHGLNSHAHSLNSHVHSLNSHNHDLNSHTHSLNSHVHSLNSHVHGLNSHTHNLNSHTHTLNSHTHDLANHFHDLSESIITIYGIFRESAANTYLLGELEYRVNGGAWAELNTAVSQGGGWYQLDVTASLVNATTLRPVATNNTIEVRGARTINLVQLDGDGAGHIVSIIDGDEDDVVTGDTIVIAGTTLYDGTFVVTGAAWDSGQYLVAWTDTGNTNTATISTGTVGVDCTATIDAQLSVRNIIQAILYN